MNLCFLVEYVDEVCSNTTANDFETPTTVQKDNYPSIKFYGEGAFFLSSIFIIYEHKDLTQTLYCCFIRAKALCSSLFALDFVLNFKVTV